MSKYVRGAKLRARGTGELTSANLKLDATIKCVDKQKSSTGDQNTAGGQEGVDGQSASGDQSVTDPVV